jgi:Acyl-CoA dehydrogenases
MAEVVLELSSTPELDELRHVVRDFMTRLSPVGRARALTDGETGYDQAVWRTLCDQLALPALTVPVRYGGQGYTAFEQSIVLAEMGRELHSSPYLASAVLAVTALRASGDDQAMQRYLPQIASGALTATCAFLDARVVATTAGTDDARLEGTLGLVIDGATAEVLFVFADGAAGQCLYAVDGEASGVTRRPQHVLDRTRPMARVDLDQAPARRIGGVGDGKRIHDWVRAAAICALASELVGSAERCLEIAVEHAKARHQFGRPIGSFQAVKHACADMLIDVESVRSTAIYLARLLSEAVLDRDLDRTLADATAVAAHVCGPAATRVAKKTIQVLGGIGYTWEHDAHLYLRRAKSSQLLLGSPSATAAGIATVAGFAADPGPVTGATA